MVGRRIEQEEPKPVNPILLTFLLLGGVALVWGALKIAEKESKK